MVVSVSESLSFDIEELPAPVCDYFSCIPNDEQTCTVLGDAVYRAYPLKAERNRLHKVGYL